MFKITWILAICCVLTSGCHTSKLTQPSRTASELLLLSYSADHALEKMNFSNMLAGKKVFLDTQYFDSVDKSYVLGAVREKLGQDGATLVKSADEADFLVEARNRGLGLDTRSSLLGFPAMDIPIPFAGQVQSPELAFFKADMADSIASFALAVYRKSDGWVLADAQSGDGLSKFNQYQLLGVIKWRSTDIAELQSTSKELKRRLRSEKTED